MRETFETESTESIFNLLPDTVFNLNTGIGPSVTHPGFLFAFCLI